MERYRFIGIFFVCTILPACYVSIGAQPGGSVHFGSANGELCNSECLIDTVYAGGETYVAVAEPGFEFDHWEGATFFCAQGGGAVCVIGAFGPIGDPLLDEFSELKLIAVFIESDEPEDNQSITDPILTAASTTITYGESVELTATHAGVSGVIDVKGITFGNSGGINDGEGSVGDGDSIFVSPIATTTYQLTVTLESGDIVVSTVSVEVEPPPTIALNLILPVDLKSVNDYVEVRATIESEFDLLYVKAEVEGISMFLPFIQVPGGFGDCGRGLFECYWGLLSLTDITTPGLYILTVTAEDVQGTKHTVRRRLSK